MLNIRRHFSEVQLSQASGKPYKGSLEVKNCKHSPLFHLLPFPSSSMLHSKHSVIIQKESQCVAHFGIIPTTEKIRGKSLEMSIQMLQHDDPYSLGDPHSLDMNVTIYMSRG